MATAVAVKPVRKFPPPCWTRDEALVLIEAYSERWNSLHRVFLKTPDWDTVAEKVTTSCPDVTPPKTSAQCRHKMEKLRQRHRAEKLRASSFPGGKFFSSWFYFEAMEAVENGANPEPGNNNSSNPDHQGLNPGRGIRFKPSVVQNLVTLANHPPVFDARVSNQIHTHNHNQNTLYMNNGSNQLVNNENENGYFVDSINETSFHPGYKNHKNSSFGGIRVKPSIPDPAPWKFSKVVHDHDPDPDHEADENREKWIKVQRNTNFNQTENNWSPNLSQGKKRGNDGIHEVVLSIKLLGDGFMKMEEMKIDMAREIERMRMDTEMKRNQLILESQKQIVDVLLKGLIEIRKQEKIETMADS